MGLIIIIITVTSLLLAYRYYSIPKSKTEVEPSWSRSTPARRYLDSIDFIPTPKGILTGFQFKSISLDVIIGPVIAIQFGWLPAVLWLLLGSVFFGWVQDYLVTILSMRRAGGLFSDLVTEIFKSHVRPAILIFLLIFLLTILGQFGILLSTLLIRGTNLFGVLLFVLTGLLAGQMIYRWRVNLVITSAVSILIIFLGFLFSTTTGFGAFYEPLLNSLSSLGPDITPLPFSSGNLTWQAIISLLLVLIVCFFGAVLPVWRFTVPFNFVSSWVVILAMITAVGGYLYGILTGGIDTQFEIPAFVTSYQSTLGPIWPILFVTLSSGAISGWNALVSSFTTSQQVEKEPLALPITTVAKFAETVFVVLVIIIAATFGVSTGTFNPDQDYILTAGPASVFATGMARIISSLSLPGELGASFSTLLLTIMMLTIMQLVMRITRIVSGDLIGSRFSVLRKPSIMTGALIIITLVIILFGFWRWLWVLFAGANQLLAAIALMLASTWLAARKKSFKWTLLPAIFLYLTALSALIYSAVYRVIISIQDVNPNEVLGNLIVFTFGLVFIITGSIVFFSGWRSFTKARSETGTRP